MLKLHKIHTRSITMHITLQMCEREKNGTDTSLLDVITLINIH